MKLIEGLTDQSKQSTVLTLTDGSKVLLYLEFRSQQKGWFFDITWNTASILGQRLVTSPNVLRQYLNVVPFGIAVVTTDGSEPLTVSDFSEDTVSLYLLEGSDLSDIETQVYGAPPSQQQPVSVSPDGSRVIILPENWGPAGGDLRGPYPDPSVIGIHEGGGQQLLIGPIADGQFAKRVGDTLVGVAAPSGGSTVGVRTRADLRAFTGMVNKQFLGEEGYSFQGDGGGGLWFFVSNDNYSIDNDGTLVVPGGVLGTPATVGCWHRVGPGTKGNSIVPATTLDARWFGMIPDESNDCTPGLQRAFNALNFAAAQQSGTIVCPAGFYKFATKCVLDMLNQGGTITIKGDGAGSTVFVFGFGTTDTAMLEIKNGTKLNFMDISGEWVDFGPTVDSDRVFFFHDFAIATITGVDGLGLGGQFFCFETIGQLNVSNCVTQNRDGTQLAIGTGGTTKGCGGTIENCSFGVAGTAGPCFWIPNCNSIQLVGCFFAGGGPWKKFTGATITSTGSDFTVNKNSHGFVVGEYIVLTGASNAGYNRFWRVATVPNANSLTVTSTLNLGADTVTLATLTSCGLFGAGGSGANATESFVDGCFFNTGGSPGSGSVGLWLEAFQTNNVAEIGISDCIFDFGNCAIFCHGIANSDPASSCHQISISNCRPNGGPRDEFGAFRFEGVTTATLDGLRAFPGNNAPPATGVTFNTVVVSDGGQAQKTQDISITGGTATNKNSTALYTGATIQAFVFDGANVHNVSVQNVGVDATQTVASFINSAAAANGITVMYADNAGRVQLIDSTGTHAL